MIVKRKMNKKKLSVILLILALVFAVATIVLSLNPEYSSSEKIESQRNSNQGNVQLIVEENEEIENAKG
jgi:flagellar basal body-associated protein FliL